MNAPLLYPGIDYFTLAKEIPSGKVGDVVTIIDADGRECLFINQVEFALDYAKKYPEWFTPVTQEEHLKICKENTILYIMENHKKNREEAEVLYEKFEKDDSI